MDKKLTLSLDQSVIEMAKLYAKKHNISVSKLIESYLKSLTIKKGSETEITPLVQSLSGVIDIPSDFNFQSDYSIFLIEKYK